MTTDLNYKGYEKYFIDKCYLFGGVKYIFRFDNGYGASVIKHAYSYGHEEDLWELAVLEFDHGESYICYDTEITDDVIGHLTDEEVHAYLDKIKGL